MVSQSVIFNASPSSIAFSVGTGSALHHVWRQHARARRNIQSYGVSSENKWVLQQHGAYQTRWMLERRGVNLTANTCRWYLTKHCGLCRSKQTTWFFFLFFIHSCIFVRAVLYVTVACMLETHIWIYTCRNTSRLANIHTHVFHLTESFVHAKSQSVLLEHLHAYATCTCTLTCMHIYIAYYITELGKMCVWDGRGFDLLRLSQQAAYDNTAAIQRYKEQSN